MYTKYPKDTLKTFFKSSVQYSPHAFQLFPEYSPANWLIRTKALVSPCPDKASKPGR